jgi:hypothetical protein
MSTESTFSVQHTYTSKHFTVSLHLLFMKDVMAHTQYDLTLSFAFCCFPVEEGGIAPYGECLSP